MSAIEAEAPRTETTLHSRYAGFDVVEAAARSLTATTFEALRAEAYVDGLFETGWLTRSTAAHAIGILRDLRRRVPALQLPNVAPGPDDLVAFTWRTADHYLSLELHGNGRVEVFHEDLRSGALWSDEGLMIVPDPFIDRLRQIL